MIFQFPNLDTFRLAVTSAQVPVSVSLAPARIANDVQGAISIEPLSGIPPKTMQNALKRLGIKTTKNHLAEVEEVGNWLQAMPVQKEPHDVQLDPQVQVLFDMPASELPSLVGEMLRLGNDRQTIRYFERPSPEMDKRVLLRVIGPPYYTLLRAIDRTVSTTPGGGIVAYVEKALRVWVEVGHNHPFASQIRVPEGQLILLRPPRRWTVLEDAPFEDIYHILDFRLPQLAVNYQERELKGKLSVPLRLIPGNAAEIPEMWVLVEEGVDILDAFVREADEILLRRLSFAVAMNANGPATVILRTRQQRVKSTPPTIVLDKAIGFKARKGFDNLYLPIGMRLQPTLRKDALRTLLLPNDEQPQVVWLMPGENGRFTPESIAEEAFRPLEDWVDYIIDHDREILQTWVQATQFDFEHFICTSDHDDKPKGPGSGKGKNRKQGTTDDASDEGREPPLDIPQPAKGKRQQQEDDFVAPQEIDRPSLDRQNLDELETIFLEREGPLDASERLEMWPRLAVLNTRLNLHDDAAICWLNVIWETPDPPIEWIWQWLHGEDPKARRESTASEFDEHFANPHPLLPSLRLFVSRILWCARSASGIALLRKRLPEISRYLETNENALPFRAVWLAWLHLCRLSGADVLGLARVRDRLLHRLLPPPGSGSTGGLNRDRDLPRFVRTGGNKDGSRIAEISRRVGRLYHLAQKWGEEFPVNRPYFDLMFAFGLAKLGDHSQARELKQSAAHVLANAKDADGKQDPVHSLLLKAFEFRIERALQDQPHEVPLPREILTAIDSLDNVKANPNNSSTDRQKYVVNRFREQSWILDPNERLDPYRLYKPFKDNARQVLAELTKVRDPKKLADGINNLLREHPKDELGVADPELMVNVLTECLVLSGRAGESLTLLLLPRVPSALIASLAGGSKHLAEAQCKLVEQSLIWGGHYGQIELVNKLIDVFIEILKHGNGKGLFADYNRAARECLRTLRKLKLADQSREFLTQMAFSVEEGKKLENLRAQGGTAWIDSLRSRLALSEGWMFFEDFVRAKPVLDEASQSLFAKNKIPNPVDYTKLVRSYISAIGQAPVAEAFDRIDMLFQKMQPLPNSALTKEHFSKFHVNIVEDVVRTMLSENFTMNETTRRWLEDDEYLVRRRIHADMKKYLHQSGM